MSVPVGDHGLLVQISTSLARLESKVDALDRRLDSLDKRLEDHETRLRAVEADYVSESRAAVSRRWLIGLVVASTITILATWVNIVLN